MQLSPVPMRYWFPNRLQTHKIHRCPSINALYLHHSLCTSSYKSSLGYLQCLIQCKYYVNNCKLNTIVRSEFVSVRQIQVFWSLLEFFLFQIPAICGWLNSQMQNRRIGRADYYLHGLTYMYYLTKKKSRTHRNRVETVVARGLVQEEIEAG